jgi:hypothetical protein
MSAPSPTLDDLAAFIKEQQSHTISQNRRKWIQAGEMLKRYRDALALKSQQPPAEQRETIDAMLTVARGR